MEVGSEQRSQGGTCRCHHGADMVTSTESSVRNTRWGLLQLLGVHSNKFLHVIQSESASARENSALHTYKYNRDANRQG